MDSKNGLIFGVLAFLGVGYFVHKNAERRNNRNADNETRDLANDSTRQALAFKALLNVNNNYGFWTVDKVSMTERVAALFNICLSVTNWAQVQDKFLVLCNNEKRLTDCLQEACNVDVFNKALNLAASSKVETSCSTTIVYDVDGERVDKSVDKGAYLGAVTENNNLYVSFITSYQVEGFIFKDLIEVTGTVAKSCAKIL